MYTFRSKIGPTVFRAMSLGVILLSFWKVGARQPKNLLRGSTQESGKESLLGSYLFSKICKEFLKILERIYMQQVADPDMSSVVIFFEKLFKYFMNNVFQEYSHEACIRLHAFLTNNDESN